MKRSILFSLLFAIIMTTSCSDNKISEDKVPPAVVNSFKTKYPAAADTKWITEKKDGKTIYEAQFKSGKDEVEAEFNEDGTFIKED
ncbi:MAG TPA: PepSY-like domain-containing protein [Chitinophagaceae bacterium]|nr:PepSY-like domain-containing protein [Chitinophagaceae bacterium]